MRHALAVVAALNLIAVAGGVLPARGAGPEPIATAVRLLVVMPPTDAGPERSDLGDRLRLADPAAAVVVLTPEGPDRIVPPFRVTREPPTGPDAAVTLRVESPIGPPLVVELVPDAGSGDEGEARLDVAEVVGGPEGVTAWRIGHVTPSPVELRLPTWDLPGPGIDAVMLDGAWWSLVPGAIARPERDPEAETATEPVPLPAGLRARLARTPVSRMERLVDASLGDVTGDGVLDLALSFRRPFRRTLLNVSRPRRAWVDAHGLSAHVGLFRPHDLSSIWVAGTLLRPVRRLAACTGGIAVAYSTLRRSAVVATAAWAWQGFGFLPLPELPGPGKPACIDIDLDGRPDAAIIERG